ncbi:MAG TPA: DUF2066 domain-containing protein [Gammaproteobacteria bacterium]|nr:DUF2066 domain-containing protein [Gammaproteobacteria bacterium]HQZ87360.1 DUF2066 domain-containing protein [Gammaproteobacteria bacterium]HRA42221.1 DUF2066 domain-containing protein [Gammaproteobacteria bacterium]
MNSGIKKLSLLFFFFLSFSTGLYAVEVQLYQVELSTQNQTEKFDQKKLLKEALKTALVRISGSSQFLNTPEVTNALTNVDGYIKQFSYHQRSALEKTIKVIFNENRVNALLNSVKQSPWNKNRPLTLVWLSGADRDPLIASNMEKILNQRGIPAVFALMDLTDTALVSEQDLVGEGTAALEEAAKRYNPDVILSGRLAETNGIWQTHWRFINKGEKADWDNSGAKLNVVLDQVADTLALKLKGDKVLVSADQIERPVINHLILTVSGNLDVQQYSKILKYLRELPGVSEAEVAQIMPDKTLFELVTTQSKAMLINAIADGQILTKTPAAAESTTEEDSMVYEVAGVL